MIALTNYLAFTQRLSIHAQKTVNTCIIAEDVRPGVGAGGRGYSHFGLYTCVRPIRATFGAKNPCNGVANYNMYPAIGIEILPYNRV